MQVLVTGGGGFLGGAIVRQLLARGDDVTSVSRGNYPELRELGVKTVRGDLSDPQVARHAAGGQDAIIHVAAKAGIWGDATDYEAANVTATRNIIDVCQHEGIERLVFTSSPSVTFDGSDAENAGPDLPYPDRFLADYPRTKAKAEQMVLGASDDDLKTIALRPHLIWGPGDPHLIPRLVEANREGRLRIVGDGKNVVDLTYVENAAHAHLLALDALADDEVAGNVYFISDDDPVVIWEWINELFERLGLPRVERRISPRLAHIAGTILEGAHGLLGLSGEPRMTRFVAQALSTSHYYDMGPARRDLGYEPIVSPDDGMELLLDDLRSRGLAS